MLTSQWKDLTKSMPPKGFPVLVYDICYDNVHIAENINGKIHRLDDKDDWTPILWMEIPWPKQHEIDEVAY